MEIIRAQTIDSKVQDLIKNFDKYLGIFTKRPPFNKPEQLDFHRRTISLRISDGSAANAINDDSFLEILYQTLYAWNIGKRGSHLSPFPDFKKELQSKTNLIAFLDGLRIDSPQLDLQELSSYLWQLMDSLEINQNYTKLVACSKTLHHILPDLVVPIDRAYTGTFFERYENAFQNSQKNFLSLAMENFATIARATNPAQFIGKGWNTCQTKIIDNAIVGYIMAHR